jgi:ketosteroid isomerase-like protein
VVAVIHNAGRAKRSGIPTELRYAALYTIRDGKMVRVREYATKTEALVAVGLAE